MTTILLLSIIGIVAVLAELVLPGGVIGIAGMLCLVGAVVMTFVSYGAGAGIIALILLVVLGFATLGWWMKFFHKLPVTRKLLLHSEVGEDDGLKERQTIVGKRGEALTDIHPSGRVLIEGERIDVMSEVGEITKGATVEVIETRGPSIFVREVAKE